MRESRTSGSGRGDQGNPVPYRHRYLAISGRIDNRRDLPPKRPFTALTRRSQSGGKQPLVAAALNGRRAIHLLRAHRWIASRIITTYGLMRT